MPVSPYPDNILKPVFHQAEDARLNINGLYSILHLRIRQIFQLNQSAAFKTNIIIVFLLNFSNLLFFQILNLLFQIRYKIFIMAIQIVLIKRIGTIYKID